ncbi:MAG: LysR family transcriptional regulator [Solimonas sp.]
MDLRQLRVFVTIARLGSITRAAEAVHLTQSALSLQLKSLQDELGLPLFRRTPRGMELLPAGATLLPRARAVLDALGDFEGAAAQLSQQIAGRLRLGTILDSDFLRLGALLGLMLERHPALSTDVSHGISGWVLAQVLAGELDVGFYLGVPEDRRVHAAVLTSFRYRVAAPRAWKARVARADWSALARLPWVWTPPESVHNRLLGARFAELGASPRIAAQVDVEPSMLDLVRAGVGLSLVRESIARQESRAGRIALTPLTLETELSLVCLARRRDEPAIAAVFALAAEIWGPTFSPLPSRPSP